MGIMGRRRIEKAKKLKADAAKAAEEKKPEPKAETKKPVKGK